jgi:hypothetical protein
VCTSEFHRLNLCDSCNEKNKTDGSWFPGEKYNPLPHVWLILGRESEAVVFTNIINSGGSHTKIDLFVCAHMIVFTCPLAPWTLV